MANAQDISGWALTPFYAALLIAGVLSSFGLFHVKTENLTMFCWLLVMCCICRILYFAVPWSSEEDLYHNPVYLTRDFWLNWGQFCLYCIADWCVEAQYMYILRLWYKIRVILEEREHKLHEYVMRGAMIVFACWQLILVVCLASNEAFSTVIVMATVGKMIIAVLVSSGFLYYLLTLRSIMQNAAAMHSVPSLFSLICTCCNAGIASESEQFLLSHNIHNRNLSEDQVAESFENSIKARRKLSRITQLCFVFCTCSIFKVTVLAYQLSGRFVPLDYTLWPYITFFSYFAVEIVSAATALYTMRKQRAPQTAAAAFDEASKLTSG
jgi:hypothetical protein